MVVIHFKKTEHNQFRYETTVQTMVGELVSDLVIVNNMRVMIDKLIRNIEALSEYGPLKPESLRGLTMPETIEPAVELLPKEEKYWAHLEPKGKQRLNIDKTGYRVGVAPEEDISKKMKEVCNAARIYISKERTLKRKLNSKEDLQEHLDHLRGVIMIAYPAYHGLPPWEPCVLIFERKMKMKDMWPDCDWLESDEQSAWFANRELDKDKKLCDNMTGKPNEKATLVIKLNEKGEGAPVKEAPIDEATHKSMLAYYHKKEQEMKKLEENDEDDYMNSPWANPNALKNTLHGTSNITWKR